jgi:hypothetical protein
MHFGLKDVGELPSMEEFEKLVAESFQSDMLPVEDEPARRAEGTVLEPVSEDQDQPELATAEKLASAESDPAA